MKKILLTLGMLSSMSMAAGFTGVGYDAMIGNSAVSGLALDFGFTDKLGLEIIGNGSYSKSSNQWNYGAGARFSYAVASFGPVTAEVGLGGGFTAVNDIVSAPFFELPLFLDYKFNDHFSITGQTGISVQTGNAYKVNIFQQGNGNFFGAFAFTYWL